MDYFMGFRGKTSCAVALSQKTYLVIGQDLFHGR